MNKHSKYVALAGLLAILLMPGVSQAQIVEAAGKGGSKIGTFFKGGKRAISRKIFLNRMGRWYPKDPLVMLRYPPRSGVAYPDIVSRKNLRELEQLTGKDLSQVTPLDIAKAALAEYDRDPERGHFREKWTIFALNKDANPTEVLYAAIRAGYKEATFAVGNRSRYASAVLTDDYKLDPNGKLDDGRPLLIALREEGPLSDYNLSHLKGLNFNVEVNGEPLIFDTPGSRNGQIDFKTLFWYIKKDFWKVTNKMDANPLHIAANSFPLPDVMPLYSDMEELFRQYINLPDKFGNTALHYAYNGPYAGVNIPWLLKLGADPNISNQFGLAPTDMIHKKLTTLGNGH